MISPKLFFRLLPWLLLTIMVFTLYLTSHWPFGKKEEVKRIVIESSTILERIERMGKLELVKYNYKEVFEYKQLSDGQIIGNSILQNYSYEPDLGVVLIASGEAVGCIDLTKITESDISSSPDTVYITLPQPELCYYKLDLDNTHIYSFKKESWWSRLFSSEDEQTKALQMAYRQAETKLKEAAINSGIYQNTNENSVNILKPILEQMTGKEIVVITSLPPATIDQKL